MKISQIKKYINTLIPFFFYLIGMFPLMKENFNSLTIIICFVLCLINFVLDKREIINPKKIIILSIYFLFYFIFFIFNHIDLKHFLLNLPFIVFPILFYIKPKDLNGNSFIIKMLVVFQISVFLKCIEYLYIFLKKHNLTQLFDINNYNIPLFRDYVQTNSLLEIHPTYFSSFLLFSFIISLYNLLTLKKKSTQHILFNLIISLNSVFFIFLFSSKIILLALLLSLIVLLYTLKTHYKKYNIQIYAFILITLGICLFKSKDLLYKRFNEIKTEINKPIEGDYHNSINIRVAIIKCSIKLIKQVPFWGYGKYLKEELNICYSKNFKSDFYKKNNYNTHNFYLNTYLYGGVIFSLVFLIYMIVIYNYIKHSKLALMIFFSILIINLTENYFSRHFGIISFNYFISLFLFGKIKPKLY